MVAVKVAEEHSHLADTTCEHTTSRYKLTCQSPNLHSEEGNLSLQVKPKALNMVEEGERGNAFASPKAKRTRVVDWVFTGF